MALAADRTLSRSRKLIVATMFRLREHEVSPLRSARTYRTCASFGPMKVVLTQLTCSHSRYGRAPLAGFAGSSRDTQLAYCATVPRAVDMMFTTSKLYWASA